MMRFLSTCTLLGWALACAAALAGQTTAAGAPAPRLTLAEAVARARANSPEFQAALVAQGTAQDDRTAARAALLPSLTYNNGYIFTQDNRFVANDGPHEWISMADVHENYSLAGRAALHKAEAGQALARAQAEIAARGLTVTVTADYYQLVAAAHQVQVATEALAQAQHYVSVSQERERGGEVAHADVIKAQLVVAQHQGELREAELAREQARLALTVLLFPDFDQNYSVEDDLGQPPPLPPQAQINALAARNNPILAAAQAAVAQAHDDTRIAHDNLFPTLTLDYYYGIDAHNFSALNQYGEPTLGNSAAYTLNIPVFDWGGRRALIHQSQLKEQQARRELSYTQRQLLASLQGDYAEAEDARDQLATLAEARSLADESLRLTGLRYSNGEGTILELVDAESSDAQARTAYDQGLVRYRVALATLQTLTGSF